MKNSTLFLVLLYLVTIQAVLNPCRAQVPALDAEAPEPDPSATLSYQVSPDALMGSTMSVYVQPGGNVEGTGAARYFTHLYFMPYWNDFEEDVSAACDTVSSSEVVSVPFRFQVASQRVRQQIVEELNRNEGLGMSASDLLMFPFVLLTVSTGRKVGGDSIDTIVRFRYPPGVLEGVGSSIGTTNEFPVSLSRDPIRLTDTCGQLRMIIHRRDVSAHTYIPRKEVKRNIALVGLQTFTDSRSFRELMREEEARGSEVLRTTSSGGSVGFNMGGYFFGNQDESETTVSSRDTRLRAVSLNLIQDAMQRHSTNIMFIRSEEFEASDQLPEERMLQFVLAQADKHTASIEKTGDDQFKILLGNVERTLSMQQVNEMRKAARDLLTEGSASTTVTTPEGLETTAEQDLKYDNSTGVTWEFKGEEWVPTSAELYILSQSQLRTNVTAQAQSYITKDGSGFTEITLQTIHSGSPPKIWEEQIEELRNAFASEVRGPSKSVIPIEGGIYHTKGHWGRTSDKQREWQCKPVPRPRNGMKRIGWRLKKTVDQREVPDAEYLQWRGCAESGWCNDRGGEWCISKVYTEGCYVNTEWLAWYRRQTLGIPDDVSEICAEPLVAKD